MIKKLYEKAGQLEAAEHLLKEESKKGILRGGTTGCVDGDGAVVGQCHRKALVRYLGLQQSAGANFWFDMGFANEELWTAKIKKAWPHNIRCEEDYPIVWDVDGTQVTGRPDMVLFDEQDNPVAGVELKSVGAVNTAVGIFCEDKPKTANLLQAAHYSSQVGVPFYLIYTCFVKGPLPYWAQKRYNLKEMAPFIKEFKVWIREDGTICYDTEDGVTHPTPLTFEGIKTFYKLVVDMDKSKDLYTRFQDKDLAGNPLPYDPCGYCPYKEVCDNYEHNYDRWIDEVTKLKVEENE